MKFSNLKISHRLILLCVAYMLPIGVLAYFALKGVDMPINFAKQELLGNQYQRPLEKLLKLVPEHELLVQDLVNGVKDVESEIRGKETAIDEALKALQSVDQQIGAELQFTEEALRKAGRDEGKYAAVYAKWEDLKASISKLSVEESNTKHNEIVAGIQLMIAHSGDKSNLILDPDLDSYYIMDVTLLALPQTQARLANIISYGSNILGGEEISAKDRVALSVHASMLREADINRIKASSDTALKEDENFFGRSEDLQRNLPPLVKGYAEATDDFAILLDRMAVGEMIPQKSFTEAGNKAREISFRLWDTATDELDKLLEKRLAYFVGVKWWTLVPSVVSVLFAWVLGWYLSRSITRPFEVIMSRLSDTCKQLGSGANQMSAASQALAERATQQAASLEETAASLEQISSVSKHNTDNSHHAHQLAESVRGAAQDGVQSMSAMTEAIHSIQKSADETAQIVKVIDGIAFQTNLLALNAAVEAARAGDAGKGFAVVAEEVRNLAQRSANAAKESSEKIRQSKELADNGVKVTEEVAKSLANINQNAVKSADLMKEIAAASKEQTLGITQINVAVTELDKVTQQNSAAAEESSASAEQLTVQADSLDEAVFGLASLVYGSSGRAKESADEVVSHGPSLRNTLPENHVTYLKPNPNASNRGSNGARDHETIKLKQTQIIPLDDSDFQGF